jgi:lipoprotein-releasing system permease protein
LHLPYELFLALRYLRFHRGRTFLSVITLISVAGVTVGTAALVIALSLMAGFVQDVRNRIHSGSAHLTVMSGEGRVFAGAEELVRRTETIPGVGRAGPVLYTPAMLTTEDLRSPEFAEVEGIDPAAHGRVVLDPGQPNPFPSLSRPTESGRDGIILGIELARQVGVVPGDMVRVLVPELTLTPWTPVPRSRVYEVVETYHSEHFTQDSQRAYVDLGSARRLLRAEGLASWVEVRLVDLRELSRMKRELNEGLGPPWLVIDMIEQNQDLIKALNTEKLTLFLAIGLIVVVAALNIVSTLILMVADKIKEIGTLAAMGARPRGVAGVFVLQGLVIGVVGTLSGLALGTAISLWLDRYGIIKLNPDVYYLPYLPFAPQPLDLFVVGVAALVISLLATIYPAMKAARLDPVEAIRYE